MPVIVPPLAVSRVLWRLAGRGCGAVGSNVVGQVLRLCGDIVKLVRHLRSTVCCITVTPCLNGVRSSSWKDIRRCQPCLSHVLSAAIKLEALNPVKPPISSTRWTFEVLYAPAQTTVAPRRPGGAAEDFLFDALRANV